MSEYLMRMSGPVTENASEHMPGIPAFLHFPAPISLCCTISTDPVRKRQRLQKSSLRLEPIRSHCVSPSLWREAACRITRRKGCLTTPSTGAHSLSGRLLSSDVHWPASPSFLIRTRCLAGGGARERERQLDPKAVRCVERSAVFYIAMSRRHIRCLQTVTVCRVNLTALWSR